MLAFMMAVYGMAGSEMRAVDSFTQMQTLVKKINNPKGTLVVMDNDDTLSTMPCPDPDNPDTCQYLGGAAWFDWQEAQMEAGAQPRVADSFGELLSISGVLFALSYMPYTGEDVPVVVKALADSGVRLLVETARGKEFMNATFNQFSKLPIKDETHDDLLSLISNHSLAFGKDGRPGMVSPFQPCGDASARPIVFQQGAMFLAGQNKGVILKCILDQYNAQPNAQKITDIVFIDDSEKNVVNVHKAFKDSRDYNVIALHYTALSSHQQALTKGKMAKIYQENATKRWEAIKDVVQSNIMKPTFK